MVHFLNVSAAEFSVAYILTGDRCESVYGSEQMIQFAIINLFYSVKKVKEICTGVTSSTSI